MASTSKSRKAKARRIQQHAVRVILEAFPHLTEHDVKSIPMGCTGEDVWLSKVARECIPFSIECKNQEKLSIWEALKQAGSREMKPLLIFTRNNTDKYCSLRLSDFVDIISELYKCRKAHNV